MQQETDDDDELKRFREDLGNVILPIVAVRQDGSWLPLGTCFVVAVINAKTALAITVAHNLRAIRDVDFQGLRCHPTMPPEFRASEASIELERTRPVVVAKAQTGPVVGTIRHGSWTETTDMAIILVTLPEDQDARFEGRVALDTRPIEAGEQLVAFGCCEMRAPFTSEPDYDKQDFRIQMTWNLVSRPGPVVEVHPQGLRMYRWPGFLLQSPFDSGMSGGPVVDAACAVRGVICGDMSENSSNYALGSGSQAFACTLWPIMAIRTKVEVALQRGGRIDGAAPLLEWVRHQLLEDRGSAHEHVKIVRTPDGKDHFWWE